MKVSGLLGLGTLSPVTADRRAELVSDIANQNNQKIEDPITFSSAARSRAEAAAHPRWGALSAKLHGDPDIADQVTYDFAHMVLQPLVNITEMMNGTGPVRYTATGEPVTPESEARYNRMAEGLQAASLDLYNQERAKGTDSADIFDKLVALGDSQSAEFRGMAHWDPGGRHFE
jgi:hypothetical protein